MNKNEFENQLASASTLISVANELEQKLEENVTAINERKVGSAAAVVVAKDILNLMRMLQSRLTDESVPADARLQQASDVVRSLTGWLEAFPHSEREDITRMESTQEGMRRALHSVRDTGQARLAALRELEAVAKDPPAGPRKPGQRPLKIATVQHAKELRESMAEDEETSVNIGERP